MDSVLKKMITAREGLENSRNFNNLLRYLESREGHLIEKLITVDDVKPIQGAVTEIRQLIKVLKAGEKI